MYNSAKKKVKVKEEQPSMYLKVPTVSGINKTVKGLREFYVNEKDELITLSKRFLSSFALKKLNVSFNFGTGDAAVTAIIYGVGWQIISFVYPKIVKDQRLKEKISLAFTADYENICADFSADIKLKVILFKDIKLLLKGLKIFKRIKSKFI